MSTLCLLASVGIYQRLPGRVSGARHKQIPQRKPSLRDRHQRACHLWVRAPFMAPSRKYSCEMPTTRLPNDLFYVPPATRRLIPVDGRKWGGLTSAWIWSPTSFPLLYSPSWRRQSLQTRQEHSWDQIWTPESNYKRQMTLISHTFWQLLSTCRESHQSASPPPPPPPSLSQMSAWLWLAPWFTVKLGDQQWSLSEKKTDVLVWFCWLCFFPPKPPIILCSICFLVCVMCRNDSILGSLWYVNI